MNKEKIRELWTSHINESFEYALTQPPLLFRFPKCATCTHWQLLDEDVLEIISIQSPTEYEQICRGMEGKIIRAYKEDGEIRDTYRDHLFYGYCKRFPPDLLESDSTLEIGLFSIKNRKTPKILTPYRFPILPHEQHCGEWKQAEWAREELSERQKEKQRK